MFQDNLPTQKRQHLPKIRRRSSSPTIALSRAVETWLSDLKAQGASDKSIVDRSGNLARFVWWLENERQTEASLSALTAENVRAFLAYLREPQAHGRFGNGDRRGMKAARPSTCHTYYRDIRTLCRFSVTEGLLEGNPIETVKAPRIPQDQLQALSPETIQELLNATRHTVCPERNRAIILCLLDSGLRLSELLSLRIADVTDAQQICVTGKGNKRRTVFLGTAARRALRLYLLNWRGDATRDEPLFIAESNRHYGQPLGKAGVFLMLKELAKLAKVQENVSPHGFRRTFALNYLRNGGNLLELQMLMGHSDLQVLKRYVALSGADLQQAHRNASPADRMQLR